MDHVFNHLEYLGQALGYFGVVDFVGLAIIGSWISFQ